MVTSTLRQDVRPHTHGHLGLDACPLCDQPVTPETAAEIHGKLDSKEREQRQRLAQELEAKFERDKAAAVEAERAAMRSAHEAQLEELQEARTAAEEANGELEEQLTELRESSAQQLEALTARIALRETAARDTALKEAAAAHQLKLDEAEKAKGELLAGLTRALEDHAAAQRRIEALMDEQEARIAAEVQEAREAISRDADARVNKERADTFAERQKLTEKVQDLTRQLEKKANDELGEGAEIDLFESLRNSFDGDKISRVGKGDPGADIVHIVVQNGRECGTIVYDSKNRNQWRNEYVSKLVKDQLALRADHAILSSHKFPAQTKQLHMQESVIVANPARVIAVVQLLRKHLVTVHGLRLSNEDREKKTTALYDYMTSDRCAQHFARLDELTTQLATIEEDELKAHQSTWKKRGGVIASLQKAAGDVSYEIDQIIGGAEGTP